MLAVALADWSAENQYWLRARYGEVRFIEVSLTELLDGIDRRFEVNLTDQAIFSLAREHPELSAQRVISRGQGATLAALALADHLCLTSRADADARSFCRGYDSTVLGRYVFSRSAFVAGWIVAGMRARRGTTR
ncbi:MAG: hypothetical protein WDM89_12825 [Rhizomicrobium sp.]